jgi:hypothetical protein
MTITTFLHLRDGPQDSHLALKAAFCSQPVRHAFPRTYSVRSVAKHENVYEDFSARAKRLKNTRCNTNCYYLNE